MRQAIGSEAMPFTVANCRIVDYGIEATQRIDLGGNILRPGDSLNVANHDRFGFRQFSPRMLSTGGVAGMQDNLVTLADESIRSHEAKASG
jgi:hypothetical protein